jgi:hypothetical protein
MSISLGLYDLFGNAIPGLLYLYILNESAKLIGLPSLDLSKVDNTAQLLGIVFLGFILGQIFNELTYRFWYRFWFRGNNREYALKGVQTRYPDESIGFGAIDGNLLVTLIQHNDLKIAEKIETLRVNSILMRNFSFGFFLHGLLYGAKMIVGDISIVSVLILIASFIFSGIALYRARDFDRWFYRDVFQEALVYGNSLQDVLDTSRRKNAPQKFDDKTTKSAKK